ncbi:hypothetical protein A2707_06260 [Candidatus Saccharibacteria bacterium RIFCSPHIGHO2_01_FULL_45_15]|nr:MAG: hypothetical protein A2707_06260 [Candidatus Saccharibacteria bacterium RIFCSPHIGHO2_01_FULL_45_15]OGL27682.1 MAG: hypothetical protein A3C39_04840 [Candidatus Saccharibacteria bacterium RIFCSPHIGHO2_02_FULL_46_12]OGL32062.1 MAG: hypothetical protein A3E76_02200 [Candidatus Saccharibacteria bacterium RIFCSPHIGHO2_12_FULL_44_22]
MKLGVFDSGVGGASIALALTRSFPSAQIDSINDHKNVPYGDKSDSQVFLLTHTAIQPFLDGTYDVIILACNTATAVTIDQLRNQYPSQKFIGIEPMIKTASHLTKSNTIGVCATPATLSSRRYAKLVQTYGQHLDIIEPDCSQWAYLIENNQINRAHIESTIRSLCDRGADVIVLGCTHYHWIKELIAEIADNRAVIIEPSEAISRRVRQLIAV